MAELKDLLPFSKTLSLLYIDENQEFLTSITKTLREVFTRVDDANNATLGLGYLKVNDYDIVIVDSVSSIMNANNLIKNILNNNEFQDIIITTPTKIKDELLDLYALSPSFLHQKPFKIHLLFDSIMKISKKLIHTRSFLNKELQEVNLYLLDERKRIGRFMMNEKKLKEQIDIYKNNIHINKNIYQLTKLPSKFALQEALNEEEQAIIYLNIDYFDFINTTYGMGKANQLLKECANKLSVFLPINASIYHITADEFVILLNKPSDNQAMMLSAQIKSFFKESAIEFDEYSHFVAFSIGIDKGSGKTLFINSKAASKEARHFGGNQIVNYNVNSQYMQEQRNSLYWIGILTKAFDEDRIFTYYQPIISNSSYETKHYEVLCRMLDDNNNLVDANEFIYSAKQVGFITQITRTVIDKTFKLFKDNDYNFSINISMNDLHENYLVKFLDYKCKRYNISSSRVHLEIVEDIIIQKTDILDKQVLELKDMGYHVIIDDFGTDKSAYNRMFELQAEYIKIDGTFIKELNSDESRKLVVKSIVEFAKRSGIKTIAEHVESQEIYDIVKELEIDYSQGYFIGKPSFNLE